MSEASQKRARGADAIDLTTEDVSPREKKMRESINGVAAELRCPITQELPFDPVMAEDGKIYERSAIVEWFSKKDGEPTSPSTGAVIGKKLLPAVQTKNTIEMLIKSGAIEGEIAEAWTKKLEQETKVKERRAKAEGGDGGMWRLGAWYEDGDNGLEEDDGARAWYERSAATRNPSGMAPWCSPVAKVAPDTGASGLVMVAQAAELGSDPARFLGGAASKGVASVKDLRARFWLKKVVDGEAYKHANEAHKPAAAWPASCRKARVVCAPRPAPPSSNPPPRRRRRLVVLGLLDHVEEVRVDGATAPPWPGPSPPSPPPFRRSRPWPCPGPFSDHVL